jgi:hypothetical protein
MFNSKHVYILFMFKVYFMNKIKIKQVTFWRFKFGCFAVRSAFVEF